MAGHQRFVAPRLQRRLQPGRIGVVPDQRMAAQREAILARKAEQQIQPGKVALAPLRLQHMTLHFIFGHQLAGLAQQQRREVGVFQFIAGGGGAEDKALGSGD